MSDIVADLRAEALVRDADFSNGISHIAILFRMAADEIERLREELKNAHHDATDEG